MSDITNMQIEDKRQGYKQWNICQCLKLKTDMPTTSEFMTNKQLANLWTIETLYRVKTLEIHNYVEVKHSFLILKNIY